MFFTKMNAYGNDYVYVDCFSESVPFPAETAKRICRRHSGIGADGLVLLCPSRVADYRMRIFDPDGTEAEMCGNALRSSAFLFRTTHEKKDRLTVETGGGLRDVFFPGTEEGIGIVTDFGAPDVSFVERPVEVLGESLLLTSLSFGNPHCVLFTDDLTDERFFRLGPAIEKHGLFPERTNVEFVTVTDETHLKLRTWERGCGETLSCATGSGAAVVAAVLTGRAGRRAFVAQSAGALWTEWKDCGSVLVTGDTRIVFTGTIDTESKG